jgi:uncharacterized protein (DUF1778 family)
MVQRLHRPPVKSEHINLRITPEVLELIKRASAADGRTVSDWAVRALEAAVKRGSR